MVVKSEATLTLNSGVKVPVIIISVDRGEEYCLKAITLEDGGSGYKYASTYCSVNYPDKKIYQSILDVLFGKRQYRHISIETAVVQ